MKQAHSWAQPVYAHPHNRNKHCPQCTEGTPRETSIIILYFFLLSSIEIKKAKRKCKKEKQKKRKTIQQGGVEFTLTEYPGRANLPGPHYSPAGQSVREMALNVGH